MVAFSHGDLPRPQSPSTLGPLNPSGGVFCLALTFSVSPTVENLPRHGDCTPSPVFLRLIFPESTSVRFHSCWPFRAGPLSALILLNDQQYLIEELIELFSLNTFSLLDSQNNKISCLSFYLSRALFLFPSRAFTGSFSSPKPLITGTHQTTSLFSMELRCVEFTNHLGKLVPQIPMWLPFPSFWLHSKVSFPAKPCPGHHI